MFVKSLDLLLILVTNMMIFLNKIAYKVNEETMCIFTDTH